MCGIAGLVWHAPGNQETPPGATAAVRRMVAALARRGPDGEGLHSWPGAVLGHRRLAIFDLSDAGRQPMLSPDGSVGVVFNGAIYNFRALKEQLGADGFAFHSRTDTEVLLHGYVRWGLDGLLSRLRGMFAFALWDHNARALYLVRDRLGVKPLLYSVRDGAIAFASTPRALRAGGFGNSTTLDPTALAEFLEFGFVTDRRCIFEGITKVPAASVVSWQNGVITTREYWTPPVAHDSGAPTFEEAVEETERLLLAAVERRLDADVPVGSLLSGGIDSGLICWAAKRLGADVTAFSIGTPGDPEDETADARATAIELGIRHRVLELSATHEIGLDELLAAYGEPFACSSALGMLRVSRAVAGSATVLLTGDGGDDVFLGYPQHRYLLMAQRLARSTPLAVSTVWHSVRGLFAQLPRLRRPVHFLDYITGGLGAFIQAHDGLPTYRQKGLLGDRLATATVTERGTPWSAESGRRVLAQYLEYDRRTQFVAEYLTKVDGATMHYGLEARSPFFDQELWEFAAQLPYRLRLHQGQLKAVLRELARRRISERIAAGRKRGFSVPVERWLANGWRSTVEPALRDAWLIRDGWIRAEGVHRELAGSARRGTLSRQLWYLLVLELWLRGEGATA